MGLFICKSKILIVENIPPYRDEIGLTYNLRCIFLIEKTM